MADCISFYSHTWQFPIDICIIYSLLSVYIILCKNFYRHSLPFLLIFILLRFSQTFSQFMYSLYKKNNPFVNALRGLSYVYVLLKIFLCQIFNSKAFISVYILILLLILLCTFAHLRSNLSIPIFWHWTIWRF